MKKYIHWVGFDDDAKKINVAIYRNDEGIPLEQFVVQRDDAGLRRLAKKLGTLPGEVRCVYEAGPCGYTLHRFLAKKRIRCDVAAPSLTPRKPGQRVKTNRIDARKLAQLLRGGNLTMVTIPGPDQEALRDLTRAREDIREDVLRCRHRISKLLLRHGFVWRDGTKWTQKHLRWIDSVKLTEQHSRTVLQEYKAGLRAALDQLHRFDSLVEAAAQEPANARFVGAMRVLRGIDTVGAVTIRAEVGDLKRYATAPEFMGSTGLVPSEFSTGDDRRQGSITKAGNAHMRHALVEASWTYRHAPRLNSKVERRRRGAPPEIVAIARKADARLHKKYWRMVSRGKRTTVAAVAVARELSGFVWAIGQVL